MLPSCGGQGHCFHLFNWIILSVQIKSRRLFYILNPPATCHSREISELDQEDPQLYEREEKDTCLERYKMLDSQDAH